MAVSGADILEHFLARAPWVDRATTVDTVKSGDGRRRATAVGVGWAGCRENLEAAREDGCGIFVTHEPIYWDHRDEWPEEPHRLLVAKRKLIEDAGLTVVRLHDSWDSWPGEGIRDSWAAALGLAELAALSACRYRALYRVPETTLAGWARHVASSVRRLGEPGVRVFGEAEKPVRHVAIGTGCGNPGLEMIDRGADVLVCCYDGGCYWRDFERYADAGAGVVLIEHGTSELPGCESLARHIASTWPDARVHYYARHARPWGEGFAAG